MIVRPTDELARLRRENRELREEIEEWKRLAMAPSQADLELRTAWVADVQNNLKCPATHARILTLLITAAPEVVTREDIILAGDRDGDATNSRVIDVQMVRLRKTLADRGLPPIETVKSAGYRLTAANADTYRQRLALHESLGA